MTDDAPPSEPSPAPEEAPAPARAPAPRPAGRALAGLGAGLAIGAVAMWLVLRPSSPPAPGPAPEVAVDAGHFAGPGSPPPRLPKGPQVGTGSEKLAGSVVDAKGAPVADVRVTATPELGPATATPVAADADADGSFVLEGLEPGRQRLRVEGADIFTAELRFVQVPSDGVRIAVARKVDVTGLVIDEGRPVPGATVTIDGDALAGRRETTTDAQGSFAFDELPEGDYRVWAHESDLAARALRVPRLGAGPFQPVQLLLEPATIVVGHVVDRATHVGIAAAVAISPVDDASGEAARFGRSDADGVFRVEGVPHGRWLVDAWAPGWRSTGALELEAGRGTPEVEMVAGAIVEGRVLDGAGRPIAGATVRAIGEGALGRSLEVSADVDADQLRRFSGFAVSGLVASGAAPTRAIDYSGDPNFLPRGELGVMTGPIPFPPPPGASTLQQATPIAVAPPAPTPAAPGAPKVGGTEPDPLPADPAYAATLVTDDLGRFRITGLDAASWEVVASAPGMAEGKSKKVTLELGKVATGVDVVLSPGTFLSGTVASAHGGPLVGATITALPKGARGDRDRVVAISDGDGHYRMGPLTGDVTVTASSFGHGDLSVDLTLEPPAGDAPAETTHDFDLVAADATLRGRVLDPDHLPVRGAQISVESGDARGRHAQTDDTGWFSITAVPAGDDTVRVEHPDYPAQTFSIDTGADAAIAMVWGGAIAGFVLDHHTGEPLAGITVTVDGPGGRQDVATGARGEIAAGPLLAGTYTVKAHIPGYLPVEATVEVAAGDRAGAVAGQGVRLELERGALLAGMVRDRFGGRVAGATLTVSRDDGQKAEGRTDSEGEFRISDVPTGELRVHAEKGAESADKTTTLRPGDEVVTFTIDLQ